jgi:hypothetical protein
MVGDQGIYNSTNRPVMGPPVPKIEGGVDACSRNNWLPHMHLPHCQNQVPTSTQSSGGSVASQTHTQYYNSSQSGVDRPTPPLPQNIGGF